MTEQTEERRKYRKHSLPEAHDVTLEPVANPSDAAFMRFVGELLFGETWQVPLAAEIGRVRGKSLAPAMLHQWLTGTRRPPKWVGEVLTEVLGRGAHDLDRRALKAKAVAARLRKPLTMGEASLIRARPDLPVVSDDLRLVR